MRLALVGLVLGATAIMPTAMAQTADHPSCAPWKARWASVSAGSDLAAIDDVAGKIPGLCPGLRAEAAGGRERAARRIGQERSARAAAAARDQEAREAAVRAADPCIQARNDWSTVQSGSETVVRLYRDGLHAGCVIWRAQADERLAVLAAQRVAAEKTEQDRLAAERANAILASARAFGAAGSWESYSDGDTSEDCNGARLRDRARTGQNGYMVLGVETQIRIEGGNLVKEDWSIKFPSLERLPGRVDRFAIVSADAGALVVSAGANRQYTYTKTRNSSAGELLVETEPSGYVRRYHRCS